MPELTERQQKAMVERVEEAKLHGVDMNPFQPWDWAWHGRFEDETRPGRGHSFNGIWCDGEKLVQLSMDPYGHGYMSIADVDWLHGGEDCQCDVCEGLRDEEEARYAASLEAS
jgi:hypothetical protein